MFGKNGCNLAKVVVLGQNWLYSGKRGSIRAKGVLFGQNGCIQAEVVLFRQKWLYLGKVVLFGQNWL